MTSNISLYYYWIGRNIWLKGIKHYFSVKLMYSLYSIKPTVFSKIGHSVVNSPINCKIFRKRWKSAFHVPYFFSSKIFDETIRKCSNRFLWPSADGRLLTILKSCAKQMRNVKPAVTTWVKYLLLNLFRNLDRLNTKRQSRLPSNFIDIFYRS